VTIDDHAGARERHLRRRRVRLPRVVVGTPLYMAPEMAFGSRDSQPAVDIYSLGVLAHVLLTGRLPFAEPVVLRLWRGLGPEPLSLDAAGWPPGLAELVERCLSVDAAARPTAAEVVERLGAIAG
jgi:serine/threonine-protein kinase